MKMAIVASLVLVSVQTTSAQYYDNYNRPVENFYYLPAQPVDATQALNLSAGVSNPKVLRGRSLS